MLERKNKPTVLNGVRQAQESRGLTERQLADLVQVQPATIVAIEEDEYAPSIALSLRLAWALGYPVEQLFWLPPQVPEAGMFGTRNDEWNAAQGARVLSCAYLLLLFVMYGCATLYDLNHFPRVAHPSLAFSWLSLVIFFGANLFVQEFRVGDRIKRITVMWRALASMSLLFSLGYLGYAIGFSIIEVFIGLIFIIGVWLWALALRELRQRRRPVAYRTNAGYG